jgi:lipopolysaccharide export system protein LptC
MALLPTPPLDRVHNRNIAASTVRMRRAPTAGRIARRRFVVGATKVLLPLLAALLMVSIVIWPQLDRQIEAGRIAFRRMSGELASGQLTDLRYRGVDERGRPYAFTAGSAQQVTPERVNLTNPKGDIVTESNTWVMVKSEHGVYLQHADKLDLSGHVVLYHDDGTTLYTATAAIDLKQGAALGSDTVSAEGPFGTIDATGFALVDKGAVIQFTGPARLVVSGHSR